MTTLIPAITIKAALASFAELGLDTAQILAPTGVAPSTLEDPFAAVPNGVFTQLWTGAFAQTPDPTLPTRSGLAVPYSEFGILDHLVGASETIGEGLHILNLFLWLVSVNISLRFTHDAGDWVWVENDPPEPMSYISEQWTLAVIFQRFHGTAPAFAIEEVHLSQRGDSAITNQFADVWGVPVHLNRRHTGFRLSAGVWNLPNEHANPLLQETLRDVAEQVEIKQFEEAPLVYAIRTRLPNALERGAFKAEDIAAELGLSKRTLQRKLSAQDLTFSQLLDLYRQEQALLMLQRGERDMGSIAYALGYQEQSSFNRAFRRWTGQSPSAWLG